MSLQAPLLSAIVAVLSAAVHGLEQFEHLLDEARRVAKEGAKSDDPLAIAWPLPSVATAAVRRPLMSSPAPLATYSNTELKPTKSATLAPAALAVIEEDVRLFEKAT